MLACVLLQKAIVSPNPFKIKIKNSPVIEKLQVDAPYYSNLYDNKQVLLSIVFYSYVCTRPKLELTVRKLRYFEHYCHPLFIWCMSCMHAEKEGMGLKPQSAQINELMGSWATQPLLRLELATIVLLVSSSHGGQPWDKRAAASPSSSSLQCR